MKHIKNWNIIRIFGSGIIGVSTSLGKAANLVLETFYLICTGKIDWRNTIDQMVEVGWRSFPVIGLTSIFTGMVLALQAGSSFKNVFNEPIFIGTLVGFSIVRELGPVLTSIVISGRVGAFIASELGTMKVTEQIDALSTLGTNPTRYLAVPRFIACVTMIPVLSAISNVIGVVGGLLISMYQFNIPSTVYWEDIFNYMDTASLFHGLIKSVFFGFIIVTVSVYKGFNCEGGAEGVGKATTNAVMLSMVMILISDYFISSILVALGIS